MKFGVREICNVVFRAKSNMKIGNSTFVKNQPVLYIDTAKTSTIEGAATTVYATGGSGNTNLIAWEGEKTLTFTVEDALLSPIGFSILSGAGLIKPEGAEKVHYHMTTTAVIDSAGTEIDLTDALGEAEEIDDTAPVFVILTEEDGSITGEILKDVTVSQKKLTGTFSGHQGASVLVDYYVAKTGTTVSELQIDAENFAGYFYVEADTLFRRQSDGVDLPANITFPNVKIQSNFTFSMASTGDPSTFTFTMDAFPGYTLFNNTKKVLCVIQILEDGTSGSENRTSVMLHEDEETTFDEDTDSTSSGG